MNTIELSVNDFKAISKADIALDGITILSGINGSGKSSLSKLLYYAFKYANSYESIASKEQAELLSICHAIRSLEYDPYFRNVLKNKPTPSDVLYFVNLSFEEQRNYVVNSLSNYKDIVNQRSKDKLGKPFNEGRIKSILLDALDHPKRNNDGTLIEMLDELLGRVEKLYESLTKRNETRPYKDFKLRLELSMRQPIKDASVSIKEYGVPFVGKGVTTVPILHYIQNAVYIDTPMVVGNNFSTNDVEHWGDLNELLGLPRQRSYSKTIFHELRDDIMHGESSRDDNYYYNAFRYNREDGQSFPLFDSATGIKSFSVLQLLLRNGVINKNTLLIIDEPEAHLHPQWIVEYARIVVQMHKTIGTKFFIASHSTDFVSAIRYIAAKQKQLPSLNFYLSEESKDKKFMFDYKHLGIEIEPIFASFNKSYDKLSEYGI